jgi:transposase
MKETTQKNQDDNIKMDLKEMGWVGMDWIHLTKKRGKWWALVNITMKHQVP